MTTSTIAVRGVTKRFGSTVAVDSVDLTFGPGVTGLLGPNGAGKSTLMRMLATVAAPDAGDISIFGQDPAAPEGRLEIRRRLGYQPQEPGFHQQFSCFQFVDYVAILKEWTDRRERHDEVRRVLALVGLSDVSNRRISRLSGGMKRRLAIAQGLLGAPDLLILDEPTAGLDPEQRFRFREVLGSTATGATVLLSTHQTDDVAALCGRVVVMLDGRVHFDGPPTELAGRASGRVWRTDERDPRASLAWVGGDGHWRNIGEPPPGAASVDPTIEDGYLVVAGAAGPASEPVA
jgi:ABC-2 type transport system ATP-binding protein